ncbi:uncharacterized protein LOC129601082 isoform X2 [Paramacrobiotus metropolitanus]|uniref:uncharacterized protein LOC129601082 isoform X2 n=1 Tax=Paramacrobiotus metropolitanus TaxID=2943436 RepID=UPI00244576E9|nr:uncharacterized protein LOC129601082 isoform X2 [Paramacrobiotus metropolitanus]
MARASSGLYSQVYFSCSIAAILDSCGASTNLLPVRGHLLWMDADSSSDMAGDPDQLQRVHYRQAACFRLAYRATLTFRVHQQTFGTSNNPHIQLNVVPSDGTPEVRIFSKNDQFTWSNPVVITVEPRTTAFRLKFRLKVRSRTFWAGLNNIVLQDEGLMEFSTWTAATKTPPTHSPTDTSRTTSIETEVTYMSMRTSTARTSRSSTPTLALTTTSLPLTPPATPQPASRCEIGPAIISRCAKGVITLSTMDFRNSDAMEAVFLGDNTFPCRNHLRNMHMWLLESESGTRAVDPFLPTVVTCRNGQPDFSERNPDATESMRLAFRIVSVDFTCRDLFVRYLERIALLVKN